MKRFGAIFLLAVVIGYLGSYDGKLCIYDKQNSQPAWLFPYSVTIFPEKDQSMLEQGIPYHSEAELNRLLEDFIS